jgi:hypothetical protein
VLSHTPRGSSGEHLQDVWKRDKLILSKNGDAQTELTTFIQERGESDPVR